MRYIDIRLLEVQGKRAEGEEEWPSKQWRARAREAEKALRNLPVGQSRANVFRKYSDVWGSLKEDFRAVSHEKCWYCEALTYNDRGEMDHYRPKGGVTGTTHPGYWWLAFDWRNFRFACEICNSGSPDPESPKKGGKGNHFPLVGDEEQRICVECVYEDHRREYPMLLDPINPDDPDLITFTSDGKPRPAAKDKTSLEYLRAEQSIKTYQLDHSRSNRRRRNEIYLSIRDLVESIQRDKLELAKDRNNSTLRAKIETDLTTLRRMLAPRAEYSAAANVYLRRYRRWPWVDRLSTGAK